MSSTGVEKRLLQRFSDELADAVQAAGQAIVRVNARRRLPATGIVWASEGNSTTIVSANHVVERDDEITIVTADGQEHSASVAGRDPGSDLAVLKVDGVTLTPIERAQATRVGELVLALGRAGELAATIGIVSAVGGPWEGGRGRRFRKLISSDAPMFPGFSGGPMVNAAGQSIGLLSSHLGRGMTLAIPNEEIEQIATALRTHGKVSRGYLGIGAQPVALNGALRERAGQDHGLLIVTIEEAGPAAQSGLTIGDIIVQVGGTGVQSLDDLRSTLTSERVGQATSLRVLRGGQPQDVTVTPGEQPA